jgi:hypothetical protein
MANREEQVEERLVERVLRIAADEPPGDHYLSHLIFARKVLRETWASAIQLARAYSHRRLTRADCEGLLTDWRGEGWVA